MHRWIKSFLNYFLIKISGHDFPEKHISEMVQFPNSINLKNNIVIIIIYKTIL